MGDRKRRRAAAAPIELPISDGGPDITATDIFPTLDALWLHFVGHPGMGMADASRQRREMSKFLVYTTAAEMLRLLSFRMNSDQDMRVFDELGRELGAYDKELQRQAQEYAATFN